jgi:hypothetical protein
LTTDATVATTAVTDAPAVRDGQATKGTKAGPAANRREEPPEQDGRRRLRRSRARRQLRARKVERIIRRIDPWSVFKLTFLFSLCLWVVFMLAGLILWAGAVSTGVVENIENFITELFALESFQFEGGQLFQGLAVGGFIMVLVTTGFSVLMAVLFNLISDLTGGIRASVVELENLRRRDGQS